MFQNIRISFHLSGCVSQLNSSHPSPSVFTITGDLFPGVGGVHEGCVVDLVVDIFVLIKRECPTQADVHDDTHRPHVKWTVVALVQQNLGGQVGRGANHRATERLLADDTGKTKVTQLHLRELNRKQGVRLFCGNMKQRLGQRLVGLRMINMLLWT